LIGCGGRVLAGLLAVLAFTSAAAAHALLESSVPADGSILREAPTAIRLVFSAPIDPRFSIFKIYPVPVSARGDERSMRRAAAVLVSALIDRRGHEPARVDEGVSAAGRTTREVGIRLRADARPGVYVVMWKVLSIDSHVSQDYMLFVVRSR
jgi:methionine-rich copper-binding protein CopC